MSQPDSPGLNVGVVIATRHRAHPLRNTLADLNAQTHRPALIVVVDSSQDDDTESTVKQFAASTSVPVQYRRAERPSAARQRNAGAALVESDLILFLDDDLAIQPQFVDEVINAFHEDEGRTIGGVSGTIENQTYSHPRTLNRLLLRLVSGFYEPSFAGRVVGPGVNFLPADRPDCVQEVDWLPSTCTAYRRDVFLQHRFCESFEGYSFAEDVHLSTRIAKTHRLLNTTKARVFHHDLGKETHKDWRALGESMVRHRHLIMADVLGRNGWIAELRLFAYEMGYSSLAWLAATRSRAGVARLLTLLRGKLNGFAEVWFRNSDAHLKGSRLATGS